MNGHGLGIAELVIADDAEPWRQVGFAVEEDGTARLGLTRLRFVGEGERRGIRGWSLRGLDDAARAEATLDGIPTELVDEEPAEPGAHPNGVVRIDHIVVLSPDRDRTVEAFGRLDIEPRRTRVAGDETAGDRYTPMLQTFFRLGEVIVELVTPAEPATGEGAAKPARLFGLALTVADIDATAELLGEHVGRVKPAVQPGRRITTLRHRELGLSVATAFMGDGEGPASQ